jgi:hypothetical protein
MGALLVCAIHSRLEAGESSGPAVDPDTEVARRHFATGSEAYERGDYTLALREFEHARLAKPLPAFDYNIARCHDRLEHYPDAIAAYQRFADATTDPKERGEVVARIEVLRARLRSLAPPRLEPPSEHPPAAASHARAYAGPAIVGAVGIASLAAGLGLYGSVIGPYNDLQHGCAPNCAPAQWQGLQDRERVGIGLAIGGGVIVAADVAYFLLTVRAQRRAARENLLGARVP